MMKIPVIIPALNEARAIGEVVASVPNASRIAVSSGAAKIDNYGF
jgi:glycosyltransferase involved in cell wall biosynthesis